jgi:hypothetical protein
MKIRSRQSAKIILTKLAAAERQLNAAIRMTLANEDILAIHTVAHAAYRILRDIRSKRSKGRSDLSDIILRGIFSYARDLAEGRIQSFPEDITGVPWALSLATSISEQIKSGEFKAFDDVPPIVFSDESEFWGRFYRTSNFLKHADRDPDHFLDESEVDSDQLLQFATGLFVELCRCETLEMEAYRVYRVGDDPEFSPLSPEARLAFGKLTPMQKRKKCLAWLRQTRREEAGTRRSPSAQGAYPRRS